MDSFIRYLLSAKRRRVRITHVVSTAKEVQDVCARVEARCCEDQLELIPRPRIHGEQGSVVPRSWTGCRATVRRAGVGSRAELAEGAPTCSGLGSLGDELANHRHELRHRSDRVRPYEAESQLVGNLFRVGVEIPEHLDVVREETDRDDDDVADSPVV